MVLFTGTFGMSLGRVLLVLLPLLLPMPAARAEGTPVASWEGELDEGFVRSASDPLAVFFEVFPLGGDIEDIPALGTIEVNVNLVTIDLPAAGGAVDGSIEFATSTRYEAITMTVGDNDGGFKWGPNTFHIAWSAEISGTYAPGASGEPGTINGVASGRFTMICTGVCPDLESSDSFLEQSFDGEVRNDSLISWFADTAPAAGFTAVPAAIPPPADGEGGAGPTAAEPAEQPVTTLARVAANEPDPDANSEATPPVAADGEESFPAKPVAITGAIGLLTLLFWYWLRVIKGRADLGYADSVAVSTLIREVVNYPRFSNDGMMYDIGRPLEEGEQPSAESPSSSKLTETAPQ